MHGSAWDVQQDDVVFLLCHGTVEALAETQQLSGIGAPGERPQPAGSLGAKQGLGFTAAGTNETQLPGAEKISPTTKAIH
jgi:hypothetical protein